MISNAVSFAQIQFTDSGQKLGNGSSNDVILWDFDGDGDLDAFVANGTYNMPLSCQLWLNDGKGIFTASGQDFGTAKTYNISVADLNNDGIADVFFANGDWNSGDSSRVWINDGHGNFTSFGKGVGKANTSCTALADLDGDGDLDVFMANHPYSNNQGGEDEVWFNDGKGNFVNSGHKLGGSAAARRVKLVDVDGNGTIDAIVLNGGEANKIWLNDGKGKFTDSGQNIGTGENIDLAVRDIDNDNDSDIVIVKGAWGNKPKGIEVWKNDRSGYFSKTQTIGTYDGYGIDMFDLNHDGYLDIILVNGTNQPNQIFINNGTGSFSESGILFGNGGNKVAVGDFNRDEIPDVFIVNDASSNSIWFGQDETSIDKERKTDSIDDFRLNQNYPNPFNPSTMIPYSLAKSSFVKLNIYNLLGQKIRTLQNSFQSAGKYSLVWDARDESINPVSSGIYFYRFETDEMNLQRMMVLVR
jgi:hypothetical protein